MNHKKLSLLVASSILTIGFCSIIPQGEFSGNRPADFPRYLEAVVPEKARIQREEYDLPGPKVL